MSTTFEYRALDAAGRMLTGTIEAESRAAVMAQLDQAGFTPLAAEARGAKNRGPSRDKGKTNIASKASRQSRMKRRTALKSKSRVGKTAHGIAAVRAFSTAARSVEKRASTSPDVVRE